MGLTEYRRKRDFKETTEPAGGSKRLVRRKAQLSFVVQKHAARQLHYDFRLEMEGVLKSWAVPKGLPLRQGERHLAVHVEDHPLEYAGFEGTIAPGNYGAGTVMVWDRGTYSVHGTSPAEALSQGKLHLTLAGTKLKGDWTLVRIKNPRDDRGEQWLLLKTGGDATPIPSRAQDKSVVSKRTMDQIARDNDAQWESGRPAAKPQRVRPRAPAAPTRKHDPALDDQPREKPRFVEPMKALLTGELPKGRQWVYEIKFDGFRALAVKSKGKVSLVSRNGKDMTRRYPEVAQALEQFPSDSAVLDGEVVAVDAQGRSSFQLLQSYLAPGNSKPPLLYYVFDILNLDGRSLVGLPLTERKEILERLLHGLPDTVRFSAAIEAESSRLLNEMKRRGLEGVIAKRKDSRYEPGRRSGAWAKFKWSNEQEFVIGGFTPPKGNRRYFGAILAGYYEREKLLFASKVGAGFSTTQLRSLHGRFQKLRRSDCPFANLPERIPGGLTAAAMRKCTWLKPELVCQVRFTEWTRDNHLRHPLFLGLREDKTAREVVKEEVS